MTDSSGPTSLPAPEVRSAPLPPPAPNEPTSAPELQETWPDTGWTTHYVTADNWPAAYPGRTPREGELTAGWRIVTAITWIAVVLAFATVWNVSVQLGLSTWWLGPRGEPQPRIVQLTPFVGPLLMILGTINQTRWLAWYGLLAAGVLVGYGVVDIVRIGGLGVLEVLIAAMAGAVSLASLTGTYRRDPAGTTAPQSR